MGRLSSDGWLVPIGGVIAIFGISWVISFLGNLAGLR